MTHLALHSPILQTVYNALRVLTELRPHKPAESCASLRHRQLVYIGDLLLDAMRLEQELGKIDLSRVTSEEIARWKACRDTIDQLVEDYVATIESWRAAVVDEAVRR